jgi:hypothetical protein
MVKRIIFSVLLILFAGSSFYVGLKPFGIFSAWQDQNNETEKGLHKSLSIKSGQVFDVWTSLEKIHGTVNILMSTDTSAVYTAVSPLESLSPYEKTLARTSKLFQTALGTLFFEKTLLTIYIFAAFFIFIPVCVLVSVPKLWKQKDVKELHRIVIVSVLISLLIPFVVPLSLKLATLTDEKVLSGSIEDLVSSINEETENAEKMENTLKGTRRLGTTVTEYITNAGNLSSLVIKYTINFLIFFLLTNVIIPVLAVFGLYKLTKYFIKLILNIR